MLTCREASGLLSESRERKLGWRATLRLRVHLALCSACRNFDSNLRILREAMRRYVR
jgi:putative zinc finger protein